ncbi:MAG: hypothetical protein EOP94_02065 [Zymomonas sp.]|nr:MAG: hypothetical protein EOP94_02065 [Zymomonas sp.]
MATGVPSSVRYGSSVQGAKQRRPQGPVLQAVAWELMRIGDDAPHLIRALACRLENESLTQAGAPPTFPGSRSLTAWLPVAFVISTAMTTAALILR